MGVRGKYIWMDGKFIPWKKANIHFVTHTFHYSGGAFEGIRFYKTAKGIAVFRLKEHLKRLFYSANCIGIKPHFSQHQITEAIKKLIIKNKLGTGYIRPLIYYGYGKMGVDPRGAPMNIAIGAWPWKDYLGSSAAHAYISSFMRIHPKSTFMDTKICGNYANSILAGLEARNKGYTEAILLDFKGHIAEGPGENVFMVKKGILITPQKGTILPGITRDSVLKLAKDHGIKTKERTVTVKDFLNADEAFFTGTATEIEAMVKVNGQKIGNGKIGPVTARLKQSYAKAVRGKNPKYLTWLTFVS